MISNRYKKSAQTAECTTLNRYPVANLIIAPSTARARACGERGERPPCWAPGHAIHCRREARRSAPKRIVIRSSENEEA